MNRFVLVTHTALHDFRPWKSSRNLNLKFEDVDDITSPTSPPMVATSPVGNIYNFAVSPLFRDNG